MSREDAHFKMRLPAELKDRVEAEATRNKRSMNAEMVHILLAFYEMPAAQEAESLADILREHTKLLREIADSVALSKPVT